MEWPGLAPAASGNQPADHGGRDPGIRSSEPPRHPDRAEFEARRCHRHLDVERSDLEPAASSPPAACQVRTGGRLRSQEWNPLLWWKARRGWRAQRQLGMGRHGLDCIASADVAAWGLCSDGARGQPKRRDPPGGGRHLELRWQDLAQRPGASPPFEYFRSIAADQAHAKVVVFGGKSMQTNVGTDEVWIWDGTTWSQA